MKKNNKLNTNKVINTIKSQKLLVTLILTLIILIPISTQISICSEETWKIIDPRDSNVVVESHSLWDYRSSPHRIFTQYPNENVRFKFKGTQLRVYSSNDTNRSTDIKINLDGIEYTYSSYAEHRDNSAIDFEKVGLDDTIHEVIITTGTDNQYKSVITGIGLNQSGELVDISTPVTYPDITNIEKNNTLQENNSSRQLNILELTRLTNIKIDSSNIVLDQKFIDNLSRSKNLQSIEIKLHKFKNSELSLNKINNIRGLKNIKIDYTNIDNLKVINTDNSKLKVDNKTITLP